MPSLPLKLLPTLLAFAAAQPPDERVWTLHRLDPVKYSHARCLDGSFGAYYLLPGDSQYILHLQGGGWCGSLADCAMRAKVPVYPGESSIGSTAAWGPGGRACEQSMCNSTPPCESDGGSGGFFSNNATINPIFASATKVWLGYCSGDGFSGTLTQPVAVNATTQVYFAGSFILDAILNELFTTHSMSQATTVVLGGCSAGGASTFAHADYVGDMVAARTGGKARYAAIPGAGFLLDFPPYNNQPNLYTPLQRWVYTTMGANTSGSRACIQDYQLKDPGNDWKCFMPQYSLPYIKSPLFVVNSAADSAQLEYIVLLGCYPQAGNCNASQLAYFDSFHDRMVSLLAPVLHSNGKHGAFLLECVVHVVSKIDGVLDLIHVEGELLKDVFSNWWAGNGGTTSAVDAAWTKGGGKFGGNKECELYGPMPSWPSY